jgi:hypothetical protein
VSDPTTPPRCACDPEDWRTDAAIPPICASYQGSQRPGGWTYCEVCEHDRDCHGETDA